MVLSKIHQKHLSDIICKMYEVHDVDFYEQVFLKLPANIGNDLRKYMESGFKDDYKPKQKFNINIPDQYKCKLCMALKVSCFVTNSLEAMDIHLAQQHLIIANCSEYLDMAIF